VSTLNQHDPGANAVINTSDAGNFSRRVASALVLAPIGLLISYLGGWLFVAACAIAAGVILSEWTLLVIRSADPRILVPGIAALLAAAVLAGESAGAAATGTVAIGAILAGGVLIAWPRPYPASEPVFWAPAGVIYAGVALVSPVLLRNDPELGLAALVFLFATVWATDVFAYLAGRAVGGPLLWPQVSPNKTWAGAVGGVAGGVAAGTSVAYASGVDKLVAVGIVAFVLSILTQAGDLFESAVKRRFGAKDASGLIPGHGGLMDRLDGFLVAAFVALLIGMLRQGPDAPAQGLLVW
jgi:phosphatidate cytidylyltransferase